MKDRGIRRTLVGQVVSNKMDKTVVVRVERLVQDPRYKKYVRRYSKFMAHDENNACAVGDRVRIIETRDAAELNLRFFKGMQAHMEGGKLTWFGREVTEEELLQIMRDEQRLIYEFDVQRAYGMYGEMPAAS